MKVTFTDEALAKIKPYLIADNQVLLTFEDGVGPYSQHAMIHMQVQFSLNIIRKGMSLEGYDQTIESNLGQPIYIKGYSVEDLDEDMTMKLEPRLNNLVLTGSGGIIDENVGFIDFTKK